MKPPPFDYHAPTSLAEILALLAQHGPDARVIAGGQSLVPLMNLRMAQPAVLIDLNRCKELAVITPTVAGVSFGAMVRQRDALRSPFTVQRCPLVAQALHRAGPVAVRNRATVGGTLAHADRSAELPGVAVALDASFLIASTAGQRTVPASDFVLGDMMTAIGPEEMLVSVVFPDTPPGAYTSFVEIGLRREGVALVGLAAMVDLGPGAVVRSARLAVIGVEPTPVRLKAVEARIAGQALTPGLVAQVAADASAAVDPMDDATVTADYRRFVAGSLVTRALDGAMATLQREQEHA